MNQLVSDLQESFANAADVEKAVGMKAYMKNNFSFAGLQQPVRRNVQESFLSEAKKLSWSDIKSITAQLWQLPEREYQYTAMQLLDATKRKWGEDSFGFFIGLITEKSWWDTVDHLAARMTGPVSLKSPEKYHDRWLQYAADDDFWLNRTALIHQLFYKEKTDTALFEEVFIRCHHKKEFFIQKAIGWALRQYSATNPKFVIDFVDRHALTGLARKEALRKLDR